MFDLITRAFFFRLSKIKLDYKDRKDRNGDRDLKDRKHTLQSSVSKAPKRRAPSLELETMESKRHQKVRRINRIAEDKPNLKCSFCDGDHFSNQCPKPSYNRGSQSDCQKGSLMREVFLYSQIAEYPSRRQSTKSPFGPVLQLADRVRFYHILDNQLWSVLENPFGYIFIFLMCIHATCCVPVKMADVFKLGCRILTAINKKTFNYIHTLYSHKYFIPVKIVELEEKSLQKKKEFLDSCARMLIYNSFVCLRRLPRHVSFAPKACHIMDS
ncbi:hypothetical protein GCK72_003186 [Caenorhabditis remanei]|uniref:Uncharacterized protein n=1 Tax=Caenorhabditis remanei TaxID=31234 RepID=A0A6A5HT40_CAERE|nr:hypothetical protein GCK72_003186 [Caenorhabditis remanei]KAF1771360.1 hypothetical protein GCK72_003186 [Caenorhabditis remanei]